MVNFFTEYNLDIDEPEIRKKVEPTDLFMLCGEERFRPDEDMVDKRILYEITGRKQEGDHLISDTESEEEEEEEEEVDRDTIEQKAKDIWKTMDSANLVPPKSLQKQGSKKDFVPSLLSQMSIRSSNRPDRLQKKDSYFGTLQEEDSFGSD